MRKAIQTPIRQIVENAGEEASIVAGRLLEPIRLDHLSVAAVPPRPVR